MILRTKGEANMAQRKTLLVIVSEEEHRSAKIKAAQTGVVIGDLFRAALADESLWRRVARAAGKASKGQS